MKKNSRSNYRKVYFNIILCKRYEERETARGDYQEKETGDYSVKNKKKEYEQTVKNKANEPGFVKWGHKDCMHYRCTLQQLLKGGKLWLRGMPTFKDQEIEIPARTAPGSRMFFNLISEAVWREHNITKRIEIVFELIPDATFRVINGIDIACSVQVGIVDLLERKELNIPHPLESKTITVPMTISDTGHSIHVPGLGFIGEHQSGVGGLFVQVFVSVPKRVPEDKVKKIREILKNESI